MPRTPVHKIHIFKNIAKTFQQKLSISFKKKSQKNPSTKQTKKRNKKDSRKHMANTHVFLLALSFIFRTSLLSSQFNVSTEKYSNLGQSEVFSGLHCE